MGTLSVLTGLAQAGIAFALFLVIVPKKPRLAKRALAFAGKNAVTFALAVSLFATISSLSLSVVLGMTPCYLCYVQRWLMYPIPAILVLALWKGWKSPFKFVLPFVALGSLASLYHIYIQASSSLSPFCLPAFKACDAIEFAYFGYVTIPVMALTGFGTIGFLAYLWSRESKNSVLYSRGKVRKNG